MSGNRCLFPQLLGNERLKKIIGADILSGKLGHAYILEGPPGSGRHTAARAASAALNCEKRDDPASPLPCGQCLSCRKIAAGVSPDVLPIRRPEGKATIGVDVIRTLREDLYIIPNENEYKIYILEEADLMTAQAQNALLLSLEEPPRYAVFFLLTENTDALLETIRSRAPVLRMELFPAETLASLLRENPKFRTAASDSAFFAECVSASGGALGRAEILLDRTNADSAEFRELRSDALHLLSLLFVQDPAESARTVAALPKSRETVLALLRLCILALRDLIAVKKNAEVPLLLYLSREECGQILGNTGIRRIYEAGTALLQAYTDIASNASVQTVFTALLFGKF